MICLIQQFVAGFLWKFSLKILNSRIILKTSTNGAFKVPNLCINSMSIALLIHGFVPVKTGLLKACGMDCMQ